jgi:hypothetical protein
MWLRSFSAYRMIYKMYCLATVFNCGAGTVKTFFRGLRKHSHEPLITIITFSIFPELTRLWYYFMEKAVKALNGEGFTTRLLIIDCSGKLNPGKFPSAVVEKYINDTHPRKLDFFFKRYIKSKLVLVSDDDCFFLDSRVAVEAANNMNDDEKLAVCSFFPRPDWWLTINDQRIRPMGSYCLMINRDIIIKEKLSFQSPKLVNPYNNGIYDTADYMNEQLLKRGYRINLPNGQKRSDGIGGFRGSSICKALEWGCSKDELIRYFSKPFSYEYHLRHNLKSFYIAARIIEIYYYVFNEKRKPFFSDIELRQFVQTIPGGELKNGIMQDLDWVDQSYQQLLEVLNVTKS